MDILLTQRNSEDMFYALAQKIDAQPTAYDVDKVVEQLEETKAYMLYENMNADVKWFNKAIEIVKGGGTDEE
jgi:hypothetical protein